jgi:hypothetical protein
MENSLSHSAGMPDIADGIASMGDAKFSASRPQATDYAAATPGLNSPFNTSGSIVNRRNNLSADLPGAGAEIPPGGEIGLSREYESLAKPGDSLDIAAGSVSVEKPENLPPAVEIDLPGTVDMGRQQIPGDSIFSAQGNESELSHAAGTIPPGSRTEADDKIRVTAPAPSSIPSPTGGNGVIQDKIESVDDVIASAFSNSPDGQSGAKRDSARSSSTTNNNLHDNQTEFVEQTGIHPLAKSVDVENSHPWNAGKIIDRSSSRVISTTTEFVEPGDKVAADQEYQAGGSHGGQGETAKSSTADDITTRSEDSRHSSSVLPGFSSAREEALADALLRTQSVVAQVQTHSPSLASHATATSPSTLANSKVGGEVRIGQVEVFVEAAQRGDRAASPASRPSPSLSSRLYLRRL